jgi:protein gp37
VGDKTGISWTDSTWNPWMGCHKVSAGCKNCYMFREQVQYGNDPNVVRRSKTTFNNPLKWKDGRRIFTCSWSDFFIEEADPWRDEAWAIIKATPQHTYQILTKRIEEAKMCLPDDWGEGYPNVWLGTTIENEETRWRAEALCNIPAKLRWISWEPSLGYVDFTAYARQIKWIIGGCESGPGARVARDNWFTIVRHDCETSGIAFYLKQMMVDGKLIKEPMLNGRQSLEFPVEVRK